ncbi:hypothetical protein JCM10908_002346 [Rhodotorula pacifica]|uniref:uncharacterized protein n=1 Tax=Rhodotorula pacifica TaxID=1495444 RepID=UPI003180CA41
MGSVSYLWDAPGIKWECPDGTDSYAQWAKLSPPELKDITGKVAVGPGCTASVTFKGTSANFGGAVGTMGLTYGCSSNEGKDFLWYTIPAEEEWKYHLLCVFEDMEDMDPLLGSQLLITNFAGLSKAGSNGKTSIGPAGMKTIPVPTPDAAYTESINAAASKAQQTMRASLASASSASLESSISKSLFSARSSTTVSTSSSSTGADESQMTTSAAMSTTSSSSGSASGPSPTSVVDSKSFTTTSFVLISATVLAIIVVALVVAMCWNTSPKKRDPADVIEDKLGEKPAHRRKSYHDEKGRGSASDGSSSSSDDGSDDDDRERRKEHALGQFRRAAYRGTPLLGLQSRWVDDPSPAPSARAYTDADRETGWERSDSRRFV